MSESTLYLKEPCGHSPLQHEYGACPEYRLVPVEAEEAWLTFEDIGPSAVWIVNHEEQPDYMGADHVLIVKIGGDDE